MIPLFAVGTEDAGWITAAVIAVPVIVKAVIDLSGNRLTQRQTDRDKSIANMQVVVDHTTKELTRLEERLEKEQRDRAEEIRECRESHRDCERRALWLERELSRNGIEIRPIPSEGSGPHLAGGGS